MIRREGRRMIVNGRVTLANVGAVLQEGLRELSADSSAVVVDLSEVTELDSSLLAALLAWTRAARAQQGEITFANLPQALQTMARLYGVDTLLGTAPRA